MPRGVIWVSLIADVRWLVTYQLSLAARPASGGGKKKDGTRPDRDLDHLQDVLKIVKSIQSVRY